MEQNNPLEQKIAELERKAEEFLNGWKRAKADYANFKRETEEREVSLAQFANLMLILELLPVVDSFDRAASHVPPEARESDWVKGVLQIKQQLTNMLESVGVKRIDLEVGKTTFDPEHHEAVGHEEHPGSAPNTVVEEVAPGYTLHGRVIRPAKVKVAK